MNPNNADFLLHFTNLLEHPADRYGVELVVRGGEKDPLEGLFTTQYANLYDWIMRDDPDIPLQPQYHFLVDDDGQILLDDADGKRDEIHLICLLPIRLWVY